MNPSPKMVAQMEAIDRLQAKKHNDFLRTIRYQLEDASPLSKRQREIVIDIFLKAGMGPEADLFREDGLRSAIIRLAHENPELRGDLLPLLKIGTDLDGFLEGFYRRHPSLRVYKPKIVSKSAGSGSSGHPEARQSGSEIWLFPKFWLLDLGTKDFVFAHEIGHFVSSKGSLADLIRKAEEVGIDPWDTGSLPFGQGNMEEAFADAFATYFLDRNELKNRYPAWLKLVENFQ